MNVEIRRETPSLHEALLEGDSSRLDHAAEYREGPFLRQDFPGRRFAVRATSHFRFRCLQTVQKRKCLQVPNPGPFYRPYGRIGVVPPRWQSTSRTVRGDWMSVSRPPSSRRNARARRNGTWRWARPCEKALSGRAPASRSASAGGKLDTLGGRSTDGSGDVKTQHAELFFWQAWQAVEEDWKHGKTTVRSCAVPQIKN
jgi:hypothetical protein